MKIALQFAMPSELRALPGVKDMTPEETVSGIPLYRLSENIVACAGGVSKVVGKQGEIKRVYNYKYPNEYLKDFNAIIHRKDEVFKLCEEFGLCDKN